MLDMQKRQDQSINPFSIVSATSTPKDGVTEASVLDPNADQSVQKISMSGEEKKVEDGTQSGGVQDQPSKRVLMVDAQTSPLHKSKKIGV